MKLPPPVKFTQDEFNSVLIHKHEGDNDPITKTIEAIGVGIMDLIQGSHACALVKVELLTKMSGARFRPDKLIDIAMTFGYVYGALLYYNFPEKFGAPAQTKPSAGVQNALRLAYVKLVESGGFNSVNGVNVPDVMAEAQILDAIHEFDPTFKYSKEEEVDV